jgi:hypothetical protein
MDSDDDGFAKQGGEPIDIGADFDDSEEEPDDDEEEEPQSSKPQAMQHMSGQKPPGAGPAAAIKGEKVDNQPFDLAVDVNDSEEIESDEEEDRMNVDMEV